jgi:uncharacterized protein YaiE (UPF0345 family)
MATVIDGNTGVSKVQDGVVGAAALATLTTPIGVGQTWTDVLVSRAAGTTYTNSTGRPIMVSVVAGAATYSYCSGFVDDVEITEQQSRDSATSTSKAGVIFIVPAGSTYKVTVNVNGSTTDVDAWFELR